MVRLWNRAAIAAERKTVRFAHIHVASPLPRRLMLDEANILCETIHINKREAYTHTHAKRERERVWKSASSAYVMHSTGLN